MTWYLIEMPPASLTDGEYHRLCREFQKAFIDAGAPVDLALFARRESVPTRSLYLSPPSGSYVPELIRHYGGRPCGIPDASTVTLVYGVPGARGLLSDPNAHAKSSSRPAEASIYPLTPSSEAASAG